MGNTQVTPNVYNTNGPVQSSTLPRYIEPWFMCTYAGKKTLFLTEYDKEFKVYTNYPERLQNLSTVEGTTISDEPSPNQNIGGGNIVKADLRTAQVKQIVKEIIVEKGTTVQNLVNDLITRGTLLKQFGDAPTSNIAWASVTSATNQTVVLCDIAKVSLLFHWVTSQNLTNRVISLCIDPYLVDHNLNQLQARENTYAAVFALLCACANIPCVIVRGLVKGGRHDPGVKISDKYIREWNAVLVDGRWRLVDTYWGAVYDPVSGQQKTDDWYLFPDPTELSYSHYPDTPRWQLLEQPISKDQFENQVYLRKRFFELQMDVLSHPHEQIVCKDGETEFMFQLCSDDHESQEFRCIVSQFNHGLNVWEEVNIQDAERQVDFIHKLGTNNSVSVEELPRPVTCTRERTFMQALSATSDEQIEVDDVILPDVIQRQTTFLSDTFSSGGKTFQAVAIKVRFPSKGVYKVEIVGREEKGNMRDYDWIAIYRISVTGVSSWQPFFPRMESIGWGPNAYLEQRRIKPLSHFNGEIYCKEGEIIKIKFQIQSKSISLGYELMVSHLMSMPGDGFDRKLNDAKITTVHDICVWSKVFDTKGQYKLSFKAKDQIADYGNIIHYLIVCDQTAKFLEYIHECCDLLEKAINAKSMEQLEKAVGLTQQRGVKGRDEVQPLYTTAVRLLSKLKRLEDLKKSIPSINKQVISVLQTMHNPEAHVVSVMTATFVILGEDKKKLRSWKRDILPLITNLGEKNLCRRIQTFDTKSLSKTCIDDAKQILGPDADLGEIVNASQDVAAFAKWLQLVFESQE